MRKLSSLVILLFCALIEVKSQVPRKIVVEHFTNTYCSVCANRNPGFFSNVASQQNVLQISIHPSAPYSQCYFNKQNKTENDGRAQYNGVFGSTPRLVINGGAISASTDYSSASLFNPYKSLSSSISIALEAKYIGDSVEVQTTLKAVVANTIGMANLFVALANEEVTYAAANGEGMHHNVFRKSMYATSGLSVSIPANAGDSLVFISKVKKEAIWGGADLFALAILNETTGRALIQAERSANIPLASGLEIVNGSSYKVYPNPVRNDLSFSADTYQWQKVNIYSLQGSLVFTSNIGQENSIDLSGLNQGIYVLELSNNQYLHRTKLIKE
jgi:hypothetical protein